MNIYFSISFVNCVLLVLTLTTYKCTDAQSCEFLSWTLPTGHMLVETETSAADLCCQMCVSLEGCSAYCYHPVSTLCHLWNHTGFESSSSEVISGAIIIPTTTTITTTSEATSASTLVPVTCPPDGLHNIAHPYDCRKYYICRDGEQEEHECSEGLLFDPEIKSCNIASAVECYPGATTPMANVTQFDF